MKAKDFRQIDREDEPVSIREVLEAKGGMFYFYANNWCAAALHSSDWGGIGDSHSEDPLEYSGLYREPSGTVQAAIGVDNDGGLYFIVPKPIRGTYGYICSHLLYGDTVIPFADLKKVVDTSNNGPHGYGYGFLFQFKDQCSPADLLDKIKGDA